MLRGCIDTTSPWHLHVTMGLCLGVNLSKLVGFMIHSDFAFCKYVTCVQVNGLGG